MAFNGHPGHDGLMTCMLSSLPSGQADLNRLVRCGYILIFLSRRFPKVSFDFSSTLESFVSSTLVLFDQSPLGSDNVSSIIRFKGTQTKIQ